MAATGVVLALATSRRDDGTCHLRTAVYRVLPLPCTSRRGIGLRRFYIYTDTVVVAKTTEVTSNSVSFFFHSDRETLEGFSFKPWMNSYTELWYTDRATTLVCDDATIVGFLGLAS
jgi:hypothetical protein